MMPFKMIITIPQVNIFKISVFGLTVWGLMIKLRYFG